MKASIRVSMPAVRLRARLAVLGKSICARLGHRWEPDAAYRDGVLDGFGEVCHRCKTYRMTVRLREDTP